MTDSFWTKVLWSRFIKHFRKLTDEQIIKDIHESMDALEDNDASGDSFGAKMVAWANERRNDKAAVASRENGNLGGRPKKNTEGAPNGNNVDESTTAFENLGSAKPSTDGGTRKDPLNMTTVRKNGKLESGTSVENICGSANTQAASNTGNVKPVTCRESGILSDVKAKKPLAGGMLHSSSLNGSPARSGAVDVLNLAYAGEFGNVRLTQEQYAQLGIKFGNQLKLNRAIDSLSCQIENGEKNPANHYAELVKWASYRDDMEEKEELKASSAPHYETVSEHNARVLAAGKKWIDEHFPKKDNKHG